MNFDNENAITVMAVDNLPCELPKDASEDFGREFINKVLPNLINDNDGIDSLLDPKWREKESKNEVLWWNLILSFMRFRLPFPYLLQGSVEQSLLVPSPSDDI